MYDLNDAADQEEPIGGSEEYQELQAVGSTK
jgi:hypothetical protein